MSVRAFVDTNIFIYAYDRRDGSKQSIANNLIRDLVDAEEALISYQVVHEFFQFALVKAANKMSHQDAQVFFEKVLQPMIGVVSSPAHIAAAIRVHERYLLSWYDSLIVAAAQEADCSMLYTEDLQHGQEFGTVKVRNPFL